MEASMIEPTTEAMAEIETRLPAAYSQGFAHIRVVSMINPNDTGPLGGSLEAVIASDAARGLGPRAPLDDLLRAD
jgi:hypothetical protein